MEETNTTTNNPTNTDQLHNLGEKVSGFFSSLTEKKKGPTTIIMTKQQAVTAIIVALISLVVLL
ncbi:MAG: hypothetical protein LBO09_04360 [Candidatus Peribacteria bacterium]|nr:hypothetical protein [Candidatus Peribacteria bacterium]